MKIIDLDQFLEACRREVEVPASGQQIRKIAASIASPVFLRYAVNSEKLLLDNPYSAWDTDEGREHWISPKDTSVKSRVPIRFQELLGHPKLLKSKLEMLRMERRDRPQRSRPHAILLHCTRCGARWFLDGNHGFLQICISGAHQELTVTELSSGDWKGLLRACACGKSPRD